MHITSWIYDNLKQRAMFLTGYNYQDANDLLQETCYRLLRANNRNVELTFEEQQKIACITIKNLFIDSKKLKANATKASVDVNDIEIANDDYIRIISAADEKQRLKVLDYIKRNTDNHMIGLQLILNNCTYKEIAEIMGVSINTALGYGRYGVLRLQKKFSYLIK